MAPFSLIIIQKTLKSNLFYEAMFCNLHKYAIILRSSSGLTESI